MFKTYSRFGSIALLAALFAVAFVALAQTSQAKFLMRTRNHRSSNLQPPPAAPQRSTAIAESSPDANPQPSQQQPAASPRQPLPTQRRRRRKVNRHKSRNAGTSQPKRHRHRSAGRALPEAGLQQPLCRVRSFATLRSIRKPVGPARLRPLFATSTGSFRSSDSN